jgi:hypothetical protein
MIGLAKPSVALGFGAFFLCAATCAHFDELTVTPLSLGSDWITGVVLMVGGVLSADAKAGAQGAERGYIPTRRAMTVDPMVALRCE